MGAELWEGPLLLELAALLDLPALCAVSRSAAAVSLKAVWYCMEGRFSTLDGIQCV